MQSLSASSILSITAAGLKQKPTSTMQLNKDSSTFIQLMGMPPADLIDPSHTLGPGLASSTEALALNAMAFPKLELDEAPSKKMIDTIDAANEDPFTLDTFDALLKQHLDAGKDFIIARILTVDEKDPENKKLFYSYYAAHQINRTLFRTQPEEGLLHRMKAKNPMNNLTIVGDVHYYVIRCNDMRCNPLAKPSKVTFNINKSTSMLNESEQVTLREMLTADDLIPSDDEFDVESVDSSSSAPPEMESFRMDSRIPHHFRRFSNHSQPEKKLKLTIHDHSSEFMLSLKSMKTATTLADTLNHAESEEETNKSSTLTFTAQYYATDDDFLMRRNIREYFKKNALNPEDIFLFTLFGASQHDGESFSSPLVSDPTNPAAVAAPLHTAVAQYLASLEPGSVVVPQQSSEVSLTSSTEENRGAVSSFFNRLRSMWGVRSGYGDQPVVVEEGQEETDLEQGEGGRTRSTGIMRGMSVGRATTARVSLIVAGPLLALIGSLFINSPFLLVLFIMGLSFALVACWKLTLLLE